MNFYQIGAQCYRDWLTASLEPSNGQEAIVVGHAGGTGRVAGMCGALLCETPDKRRFKASFTSKTVSIWCCLRPYKFPQSWNDTRCCTLKKIYLNWLSVYRVKDFDESWIWHSDSVAIGTWRWALVWVMLKGGGIFTIQRPHCLDDTARRDPPVVNAVITYRYQELTADNIPRFPTLVGWDLWTQILMHQTVFYKHNSIPHMRCRWKDRWLGARFARHMWPSQYQNSVNERMGLDFWVYQISNFLLGVLQKPFQSSWCSQLFNGNISVYSKEV